MAQVTTSPPRREGRTHPVRPVGRSLAEDLAFDSFYGGAIGGTTIALFFLILDGIDGRPLFTPSLMGSVLFTDLPATEIAPTRYDMVAYYSIVHFATFGVLGAIASLFDRYVLSDAHPVVVAVFLFVLMTSAILLGDWLFIPSVVVTIGVGKVLAANALAAAAMAVFFHRTHERA